MRDKQYTPWWHQVALVEMFEGEEDSDDEEESEEEDSDEDDEDQEEGGSDDEENVDGLKSALQKERDARKAERRELKKLQRDMKKLQKQQDKKQTEEESELETTKTALQETTTKNQQLAQLLTKTVVDTAIIEAATKERFRDVSDALSLVNRADIDIDLDLDDDEVDLDFDRATVIAAVQKLAKSKPHLILADGDEEGSGHKVGSKKGKKGDQELTEESLKKRYPVLGM